MSPLQLIISIVLCVVSLFLIATILLQSSKKAGLPGSIGGGAETFFGKNKAKTYEGKLAFLTKIAAVITMALSIVMVLIQ